VKRAAIALASMLALFACRSAGRAPAVAEKRSNRPVATAIKTTSEYATYYRSPELVITSGQCVRELPKGCEVNGSLRASTDARPSAGVHFERLGETTHRVAFGDGVAREQVGIKLYAPNDCNGIYVMWRLAPNPAVFAAVKRNPGQRTHAECQDRGYRFFGEVRDVPSVRSGEGHWLWAELSKHVVSVWADGALVWRGSLPEDALHQGAAGVRIDNAHVAFELLAERPTLMGSEKAEPADRKESPWKR
jgi:hypothetical protein